MKLTKVQEAAVHTTHIDILVSAGAGAGKTRVLVERFLNFVITGKARVTEILALTFTDKAANEMKDRIMKRFREEKMVQARRDLELSYISTIHAFAARLLKEHPIEAGIAPDFSVIESEESELMQEQSFDELIETQCKRGSDVFELLKTYGENSVRDGLKKILSRAKSEGLTLTEFFARQNHVPRVSASKDILELFEKVKEPAMGQEWAGFYKQKVWDWKTVQEFREWSSGFNRKGGKETKTVWKEIAAACGNLLGERLDGLAQGWREKFEKMALDFEAAYEARKFEHSVLDFDDLQIRALKLLTSPNAGNRKLLDHYRETFKFILVDEYQDVNPLQVKLIECFGGDCKKTPGKMFFVGDYKQSIYGFRGTSPEHFLHKQKEYQEAKNGVLIEMLENFRSQKPVLSFINLMFDKIWAEDGLENTGLIVKAAAEAEIVPQLLVIHKGEEESTEQARMREAGAIARKIQELHAREVPYGDIAVLFQTVTHLGIYEHALKAAGIPYFVVSGRGFYHQPEIRDMMSLLSALENPLLDIPLAGALRSPLFRITDETLFWLSRAAKKENENTPLYEAFHALEKIEEITPAQRESLQSFQSFFRELISIKDQLYLSELLEWILKHTAYELAILADRQGVRRYANLRKLISLARDEESRERMSLGDFIRLVRSLEAREIRESEAQVEAEQSGRVVRLMTVHAAKGLEFPVCFVADLAHQSRNPESRDFLAESGIGYSFKLVNPLSFDKEKPGAYERIDQAVEKRETEEWKRLFYVAVTRARRELILSGVYEPKKEFKDRFSEMSSWMDWVMKIAPELPIEIQEIPEDAKGLIRQAPKVGAEDEAFKKFMEQIPAETVFPDAKERAKLAAQAEAIYRRLEAHEVPPGRVLNLPASAYCAYAKNPLEYWRIYEMGYPNPDQSSEEMRESYPSEDEPDLNAADFGTLIHRVLELIDLQEPERNLSPLLAQVFRGQTEKTLQEAGKILKTFFESQVFKKLQKAKKVYREIAFVLNQRHGRIDGVIDALFQDETGSWHILDYKTAVGDAAKVKTSAYDLQMGIYAAAAAEILRIQPQSAVLYFLKNSWEETLSVTPGFLKEQLTRLQALQEEMLDYRTRMTGGSFSKIS